MCEWGKAGAIYMNMTLGDEAYQLMSDYRWRNRSGGGKTTKEWDERIAE